MYTCMLRNTRICSSTCHSTVNAGKQNMTKINTIIIIIWTFSECPTTSAHTVTTTVDSHITSIPSIKCWEIHNFSISDIDGHQKPAETGIGILDFFPGARDSPKLVTAAFAWCAWKHIGWVFVGGSIYHDISRRFLQILQTKQPCQGELTYSCIPKNPDPSLE